MKTIIVLLLIIAQLWAPTYAAVGHDRSATVDREFNLPQLGNQVTSAISPDKLRKVGEKVMVNLYNHGAILEDPLVTEYLQNIGHNLSSHSSRPNINFDFFPIKSSVINAVTLPGGFIGINTGLFVQTKSENELAGVMAHEISHNTQGHIARAIAGSGTTSLIGLAGIIGSVLLGVLTHNPDIIQGGIMGSEAAMIQHKINFTRSQEEDADRIGVSVMARAGYNPMGMANFFEYMEQQANVEGDSYPAWLVDHPTDENRIADVRERAESMHVPPHKNSRSYLLMRARTKTLVTNDPHKLLDYFQRKRAHTKGEAADAIDYGEALIYQQLGQAHAALKIMQRLIKNGEDQIPYHIALAEAQISAGQIKAGMKSYRTAMELFPNSRPLTLSYAQSLLAINHATKARNLLIGLHADSAFDPTQVHLLARASAGTGDVAEGHYYLSNYYFMIGDVREAIMQIKFALKTPGVNHFQRTRYHTKLASLETIYKHLPHHERERQGQ